VTDMEPQAPPIEIRLLGATQAYHAGEPLALGGKQPRSVLAVLLLHPGSIVSKERLIDYAWRGEPPEAAVAIC